MSLDPPADAATDHVRGGPAGVVIVEYGDYECPFSRTAEGSIHGALNRLGDRASFTFRHFPLRHKHPHAQLAAEAAEAAGAQGRFWEMHDRLFQTRALEPEQLRAHAEALGLDMARFDADLESHVHADRVERDVQSALTNGVQGTPTFFIAGEPYSGFYDTESLVDEIEFAGG